MKLIKSTNDLPATFDLNTASILTGYSTTRLRQLSQAGNFPAYKIGKPWRVDKEDYLNWINELKKKNKAINIVNEIAVVKEEVSSWER